MNGVECPICKQQMLKGVIPADRLPVRWRGDETEVRLSKPSFLCEKAEAFYCPDCRQVLIPVPEIETFWDRMMNKLDDAEKVIQTAKEKFESHRSENQEQRKNKKRKGKDPWEM